MNNKERYYCSCCGKDITDEVYYRTTFIDEHRNLCAQDLFCDSCYAQLRQFVIKSGADRCKNTEYSSELNTELGILGE